MNIFKAIFIQSFALLVASIAMSSADAAEIFWTELQLDSASGVPTAPQHVYRFKGMMKAYGEKRESDVVFGGVKTNAPSIATATFWVEGSGNWDAGRNYAEERLGFGGGEKGILVTRYWCEQDPWLYRIPCRVLGSVYSSKLDSSYDWSRIMYERVWPLTQNAVTLAKAEDLSRKQDAAKTFKAAGRGTNK